MKTTAPLVGGPEDGKVTNVPTELSGEGLPGMAFGDYLYVFTTLDGLRGWHYCGKIKWETEELARRKRGNA